MKIFLWGIAVCLVVGGFLVWSIGHFFLRPMHKAEVEGMKESGKFEDEPDYMQDFRVSRAEGELYDNTKYLKISSSLVGVGILLIAFLLIK